MLISFEDAFAALNPRDTWIDVAEDCPYCNQRFTAAFPRQVRATEWQCPHCKGMLTIWIRNGVVSVEAD